MFVDWRVSIAAPFKNQLQVVDGRLLMRAYNLCTYVFGSVHIYLSIIWAVKFLLATNQLNLNYTVHKYHITTQLFYSFNFSYILTCSFFFAPFYLIIKTFLESRNSKCMYVCSSVILTYLQHSLDLKRNDQMFEQFLNSIFWPKWKWFRFDLRGYLIYRVLKQVLLSKCAWD